MFRLCFIFLLPFYLAAQTGPAGVGSIDGNSDLSLWLKLDSVDAEMAPIEDDFIFWKDGSGKGNHLYANQNRANPSLIIKNGYPAVYFDGDDYMQMNSYSASFNNTEQTIFAVVSHTNKGAVVAIARDDWKNEFLIFNNSVYHHNSSGNFTFQQHKCLYGLETQSIITAQFGTHPLDLRLNVNNTASNEQIVQRGSPKIYTLSDRRVTLGQRGRLAQQEYLNGFIYEVIVYNRSLKPKEISRIQEYLYCKYPDVKEHCSAFSHLNCDFSESLPCKERYQVNPTLAGDFTTVSPYNNYINVRVFNAVGQLVVSYEPLTDARIELLNFSAGVYYFQISGYCEPQTIKVVKFN